VDENVKELSELLESTDEKRTTVVYQLFDNMSFMVKKLDGMRHLPKKGPNGKYHVDGKLDISSREKMKKLVSKSIPLLRAGGHCRKIVLTPAARFKRSPWCNTRGHCSNLQDKNYEQWMEERLVEVRCIIRDYVSMRNIKRVTVMELGQLITPSPGKAPIYRRSKYGGRPCPPHTKGVQPRCSWPQVSYVREEGGGEGGRARRLAGGSKAT
jgi:hypothetical protein